MRLRPVLASLFGLCAVAAPLGSYFAANDMTCEPQAMTDTVRIEARGRAFDAKIDRARIALDGEAYCERRPTFRGSIYLPVRYGDDSIPVSIQPIPNTLGACRSMSKGMALTGRSQEGLLYSDGSANEHTLACMGHPDGALTLSCFARAASCRLWHDRALEPGCNVWVYVAVPKAHVVDWRAVLSSAYAAITLTPACDRQANTGKTRHG